MRFEVATLSFWRRLCFEQSSESSSGLRGEKIPTFILTVQIPPSPAFAMFPTVRSLSLFAFACLLLSPAFASEADHKVNINSPISFALPQTLTFTLSLTRSLCSLNSHSDLSISRLVYIWVFFSSILCFQIFQHFLLHVSLFVCCVCYQVMGLFS